MKKVIDGEEKMAKETGALAHTKKKTLTALILICVAIVIVLVFVITLGRPALKYYSAGKALQAGDYDKAISAYESLGDYHNSAESLRKAKYLKAEALLSQELYGDAYALYTDLDSYEDSAEKRKVCEYNLAIDDFSNGTNLPEAYLTFKRLGSFMEAEHWKEEVATAIYNKAIKDFDYDLEKAREAFFTLDKGYLDVSDYQEFYLLYDRLTADSGHEYYDLSKEYVSVGKVTNQKLKRILLDTAPMKTLLNMNGTWVESVKTDWGILALEFTIKDGVVVASDRDSMVGDILWYYPFTGTYNLDSKGDKIDILKNISSNYFEMPYVHRYNQVRRGSK